LAGERDRLRGRDIVFDLRDLELSFREPGFVSLGGLTDLRGVSGLPIALDSISRSTGV
jgi:hypothetical protein